MCWWVLETLNFELLFYGRNWNIAGVVILLLLIMTVSTTLIVLCVMLTPFVSLSTENDVFNVTGVVMQVSLFEFYCCVSDFFCGSLGLGLESLISWSSFERFFRFLRRDGYYQLEGIVQGSCCLEI